MAEVISIADTRTWYRISELVLVSEGTRPSDALSLRRRGVDVVACHGDEARALKIFFAKRGLEHEEIIYRGRMAKVVDVGTFQAEKMRGI